MGMETDCFNAQIFRAQSSDAVLKGQYKTIAEVLALIDNLEGYNLTKYGRELTQEFQEKATVSG